MHNGTPLSQDEGRQDGVLERGARQVGDSLHSTIEKMADPVHSAVARASSTAHEGVDKMTSSVQAAACAVDEQARRMRDSVLEVPHQAADHAREYVRVRPLQAVGIAFAVGWLLGRLGA